jgi:hypothetical protein
VLEIDDNNLLIGDSFLDHEKECGVRNRRRRDNDGQPPLLRGVVRVLMRGMVRIEQRNKVDGQDSSSAAWSSRPT